MTRKAPTPAIRGMVRREGGSWIVNLGPHSPFVADPAEAPPLTLADRYTATATGELPDAQVTVTDNETGATVQMDGEAAHLSISAIARPAYVARLWQDAQTILGTAQKQLGRPPGTTTVTGDDQIRGTIAAMRRDRRKTINAATIAAYSGAFTPDNLRYYLKSNGKRLRDFL
jgi:hypothetical protein